MTKTDESYWRPAVSTRWGMTEVRCMAGQPTEPTTCTRHHTHYWCTVCEGFYGVPHDDTYTHTERARHDRHCVCRPCREFHAGYARTDDERRDELTTHGSAYHPEFPPPRILP